MHVNTQCPGSRTPVARHITTPAVNACAHVLLNPPERHTCRPAERSRALRSLCGLVGLRLLQQWELTAAVGRQAPVTARQTACSACVLSILGPSACLLRLLLLHVIINLVSLNVRQHVCQVAGAK